MARKKQYNEQEVIEKAMQLFWKHGYEATSVRMLEKEMGINQFSMYASFKNKQGVFLKSIECYNRQLHEIKSKLANSQNGVAGIQQYFYDFLDFSQEGISYRGCLVTNSINEIKPTDAEILEALKMFANDIRKLFVSNLKQDDSKDEATVQKQADFLMNNLLGLSLASKVFDKTQLNNMIEVTFLHL